MFIMMTLKVEMILKELIRYFAIGVRFFIMFICQNLKECVGLNMHDMLKLLHGGYRGLYYSRCLRLKSETKAEANGQHRVQA